MTPMQHLAQRIERQRHAKQHISVEDVIDRLRPTIILHVAARSDLPTIRSIYDGWRSGCADFERVEMFCRLSHSPEIAALELDVRDLHQPGLDDREVLASLIIPMLPEDDAAELRELSEESWDAICITLSELPLEILAELIREGSWMVTRFTQEVSTIAVSHRQTESLLMIDDGCSEPKWFSI